MANAIIQIILILFTLYCLHGALIRIATALEILVVMKGAEVNELQMLSVREEDNDKVSE